MQIINVKIGDLKPYKRNPRKNENAVDAVAASIKEFGFKIPIVIDNNYEIVAGHTRLKAATKLGLETVPCIIADDLTPEQIKAFRLADNKTAELAEWDLDLLDLELDDIPLDMSLFGFTPTENVSEHYEAHPSLKELFIVPPFSVLDARSGEWQKRKKKWLEIIKSGNGRAEGLLGGGMKDLGEKHTKTLTGTSIFDPVLTEVLLHWFSPKGGKILDPFAGGSVRGIVSSFCGREYHGMDLSQTQIDANREGFAKVEGNTDVFNQPLKAPTWVCGDSLHIDEGIEGDEFDMLLTCPPYFDLEQYSDDPADISNMNYGDFLAAYETIFAKSVAKVKDNGFIAVVVGEVRDDDGNYRNFIGDTINVIEKAGAHYYNEIVLITMLGTLPIRIRRQFEAGRKVWNTHQKALIFLKSKGDTDALREYLDDFTETRILTPMKKSILVFLKGRAVKKKELETYEFDCT